MKILTIDIGSTNIKFALFDGRKRIAEGKYPFPPPCKNDCGRFEVNAKSIADVVKRTADENRSEQIRISVQMHGYVVGDTYVSWRDRRAEHDGHWETIKDYLTPFFSPEYGTVIKPNTPAVGLYYRINGGEKIDGYRSLGAYIAETLTGNDCSHITDICASGFYETNGKLNKIAELLPMSYTKPVTKYVPIGEYKTAQVFPPIGDQQASLYVCYNKSSYLLNIGTASQMCAVSEKYASGSFEPRPFFGKILCTVTGLVGGADMRVLGFGALRKLQDDYDKALSLLPQRNKIVVLGGAINYHKELISKALEKYKLPVEFMNVDALDGLIEMEVGI